GTLSPARRIVNAVTLHASPAVFCRILPFAAADFSQAALWHERTPSRLIGSRFLTAGATLSSYNWS
ncbi:MAG TPA: hypothetical protein VIK64_13990, partial [Anaerolineales bacterium]